VIQNVLFDRKMNRKYAEKGGTQDESSND
ncbi:DUF969 domain-containing protein, partial [Staphylococcus pseudintermedius]